MGVNNNWRPTRTMDDWMRDIEKRLMREERRPSNPHPVDVVGPGFRPYALQVADWNSDGPVVGGHYYSYADQVVNSPDDTKNWMGIVQSNSIGQGLQRVWEYIDTADDPSPDPALYTRAFTTDDIDGHRDYTPWIQGGGGGSIDGIIVWHDAEPITPPVPNIDFQLNGVDYVDYDDLTGTAIVGIPGLGVENEGTTVDDRVYRLNFKGDGVTAAQSGVAREIDVTIPGGGGAVAAVAAHCHAYRVGAHTVQPSTFEALALTDVLSESGQAITFTPGGSTPPGGYFTIHEDGVYDCSGQVVFAGNNAGRRVVALRINGGLHTQAEDNPGPTAASQAGAMLSTTAKLVAGDQVWFECWQNSGGNLVLSVSPNYYWGRITKVDAAPGPQGIPGSAADLPWKAAVRAASTQNVTVTGMQPVGITVDGVLIVEPGVRVLLKNQSIPSQNGIWVCDSTGRISSRATDCNSAAELESAVVWVSEGTTQAETAWVMTTNAPITVGTTALTWEKIIGTGSVGPEDIQYNAIYPDHISPGTIDYTFVQAVPAATWTINHPLHFRPNATVVDSAGRQVEGDVVYTDGDTITITFSAAFSGTAYLS